LGCNQRYLRLCAIVRLVEKNERGIPKHSRATCRLHGANLEVHVVGQSHLLFWIAGRAPDGVRCAEEIMSMRAHCLDVSCARGGRIGSEEPLEHTAKLVASSRWPIHAGG
jgi:hypothetical protein